MPSRYRPQHKITLTICLGPLMRHTCGNQFYPRAKPPGLLLFGRPPPPLSFEPAIPFRQTTMNRRPRDTARTPNILGKPSRPPVIPFSECVLDRWLEMASPRRDILISFSDQRRVARDGSNMGKERNDVLPRVRYIQSIHYPSRMTK